MALQASDFQPPYGPLRSSLFPDDDLGAFLTAWITEAEAAATAAGKAADSPEARAFVLWRAYDLRCQTAPDPTLSAPVKAISPEDEGRVEFDTAALKAPDYCALASRYRTEADALISPLPADPFAGWPCVTSLR